MNSALRSVMMGAVALVPLVILNSGSALAQNNVGPPEGAILDLGGAETGMPAQTIDHGDAVTESVSFIAALSSTDITFALREDPAFISLSDISLVDNTTSSGNLILNGNFALGTVGTHNATDWTFDNVYGAGASGTVETSDCGGGLTTCWFDGSIQAFDAIDQIVATNIGDSYTLSFEYSDDGGLTTFSDVATNGQGGTAGNGVDLLAYAQAALPPPAGSGGVTPEPSTLVTLGTGLLSLAGIARNRFARKA